MFLNALNKTESTDVYQSRSQPFEYLILFKFKRYCKRFNA